jgi:hypothetical protein
MNLVGTWLYMNRNERPSTREVGDYTWIGIRDHQPGQKGAEQCCVWLVPNPWLTALLLSSLNSPDPDPQLTTVRIRIHSWRCMAGTESTIDSIACFILSGAIHEVIGHNLYHLRWREYVIILWVMWPGTDPLALSRDSSFSGCPNLEGGWPVLF